MPQPSVGEIIVALARASILLMHCVENWKGVTAELAKIIDRKTLTIPMANLNKQLAEFGQQFVLFKRSFHYAAVNPIMSKLLCLFY